MYITTHHIKYFNDWEQFTNTKTQYNNEDNPLSIDMNNTRHRNKKLHRVKYNIKYQKKNTNNNNNIGKNNIFNNIFNNRRQNTAHIQRYKTPKIKI